ncbi:ROK family protein [Caulobacter sp. KR2-114]|uniref:ROK family protein n=1 Tax=Caulobacter sp. KR2-114 TaxID=3400912 RepID=UPI003BFF5D32
MSILVFDLGGTHLRAGAWVDGRLQAIARLRSDTVRGAGDFMPRLERAVSDLAAQVMQGAAPEAVSMAVPGPVHDGMVERLPSLVGPSYEGGVDFAALARRLWPGAPVSVCNDLTAAGHLYVSRGHPDFGVLTLGSGVGGKLFIDGRPLLGRLGFGGEIGHWRVPGAPPTACDCGGKGHLSGLSSGRGALRLAQWRAAHDPDGFLASALAGPCRGDARALTPEDLVTAFHAGDAWAAASLAESAEHLGAAIAALGLAAGLEVFFLTGGFAVAAGEPFRAQVAAAAETYAWRTGQDWNEGVRLAAADEEPGLLGAGWFARAMA